MSSVNRLNPSERVKPFQAQPIKTEEGGEFVLRPLTQEDERVLGDFFEDLSADTKAQFSLHPLTRAAASHLCLHTAQSATRVYLVCDARHVIGYFALNFTGFQQEIARFAAHGIALAPGCDSLFALCIADDYQNRGIASAVMSILINEAKSQAVRRIILVGGTQVSNDQARAFYQKLGFQEYGAFYTAHNNANNIDMMLSL